MQQDNDSHSEFANQINHRLAQRYATFTVSVLFLWGIIETLWILFWHPKWNLAIIGGISIFVCLIALLRLILLRSLRKQLSDRLFKYCEKHDITRQELIVLVLEDARFIKSLTSIQK